MSTLITTPALVIDLQNKLKRCRDDVRSGEPRIRSTDAPGRPTITTLIRVDESDLTVRKRCGALSNHKTDPAKESKPESLWTADQVAAYLSVHVQTVYSKAASGDMPSLKIGRGLRFRPAAIEQWLEAQQPVTEPAA